MDGSPSWPSTVVAVAIIGLVGVFFVTGLAQTQDTDSFVKLWGAVGTIVGVVAGAIPSFFFKARADRAEAQANTATKEMAAAKDEKTEAVKSALEDVAAAKDQALKAKEQAAVLAGVGPPDVIQRAKDEAPEVFSDWQPQGS